MSEQIRIGMIGAGQIGTSHMERYGKIPQARIMAVADASPEKVEQAKQRFGISRGYTDFKELLHRDDIDAVDVCVHNNKHAPIAIAAFKAGKHVYCEKPIAGSFRDAEQMLQAAERFRPEAAYTDGHAVSRRDAGGQASHR